LRRRRFDEPRVGDGIKAEGGTAPALPVDVSDPASAKEMAAQTSVEFGGIDYLVNNAAIFGWMKLDFLITVDWDYFASVDGVDVDVAGEFVSQCFHGRADGLEFHCLSWEFATRLVGACMADRIVL
jgi:NAD(P)-dependent dehydrogenase (short-subunit alcohol dehydrogenase family)